MKYYISGIENKLGHFFGRIITAKSKIEAINIFNDIDSCSIPIAVTEIEEIVPLTKEILDKNFKVDEAYKERYFSDGNIIPYIIEGRRNWNLLWYKDTKTLTIEDDPLIKIKTVNDLSTVLILSEIYKEIIL